MLALMLCVGKTASTSIGTSNSIKTKNELFFKTILKLNVFHNIGEMCKCWHYASFFYHVLFTNVPLVRQLHTHADRRYKYLMAKLIILAQLFK